MFERVRQFLKGSILEIGSGTGDISNIFVKNEVQISLSDQDDKYVTILTKKFVGNPMVQCIHSINLLDDEFEKKYQNLLGKFDTVYAINAQEHETVNRKSLLNAQKLLKESGIFIALLPVYIALYEELDPGFDHWRRSNKKRIKSLLPQGWNIIALRYFTILTEVEKMSASTLQDDDKNYNKSIYFSVVPTFNVKNLSFKQAGLSVIAVAKKI
jgi:SAM-dependent methyltransferase